MEQKTFNGQNSVATSAEKAYIAGINNTHSLGTQAKIKVESYKYAGPHISRTSVWIDYYYDLDQYKRAFRHNSYMDTEKVYRKVGRSWELLEITENEIEF